MTPVMLLTDGYRERRGAVAHTGRRQDPKIETNAAKPREAGQEIGAVIFNRDPETLGRPWVVPGTPGLMYRVGGLEKDLRTGNISYDAQNHQAMTNLRADKVAAVAKFIPPQDVEHGPEQGERHRRLGLDVRARSIRRCARYRTAERVSHIHIRYLSPLPSNLGDLLRGFDKVLVPEMNMGQLASHCATSSASRLCSSTTLRAWLVPAAHELLRRTRLSDQQRPADAAPAARRRGHVR